VNSGNVIFFQDVRSLSLAIDQEACVPSVFHGDLIYIFFSGQMSGKDASKEMPGIRSFLSLN
jgi:hypothetical protein